MEDNGHIYICTQLLDINYTPQNHLLFALLGVSRIDLYTINIICKNTEIRANLLFHIEIISDKIYFNGTNSLTIKA